MDASLYIVMSAAKQNMERTAIIAQNIANANTNGYKADNADFQALYTKSRGTLNDAAYSQLATLDVDTATGTLQNTGKPNDIALQHGYWLSVRQPDNSIGYVSTASVFPDAKGVLTTTTGLKVVGTSGNIVIPTGAKFEINSNGTVTTKDTDGSVNTVGRMRIAMYGDGGLKKGEYGLLVPKDATNAKTTSDDQTPVLVGVIEKSNVNSIQAMTESVSVSRTYQDQINMMVAVRNMDKASNSLLKIQ